MTAGTANGNAIFPPAWSRQHGATISLITTWLVGTLLGGTPGPVQFIVLAVILSALNGFELWLDWMKKRVAPGRGKRIWTAVYTAVAAGGSIYLAWRTRNFPIIAPILAVSGVMLAWISLRREHKTVFGELLAFANISLAGLLAYRPSQEPDLRFFQLWITLFVYFGASIFLVKARFDKVRLIELAAYGAAGFLIIALFVGIDGAILAILALVALKLASVFVATSWYRRISIRTIGFMELASCLAVVVILAWGR